MWKIIIIVTSFFEIILSDNLISFHNIIFPGDTTWQQEFLCISDDPSDALAWNFPLEQKRWDIYSTIAMKPEYDDSSTVIFANTQPQGYGLVTNSSWQITHSYDNPMGPVYDSRWERFRLYMNENLKPLTIYDEFGRKKYDLFKKTGALVFSIRGPSMASIFLCETKNVMNDFCYWIKINGKKNMKTVIRKCEHGIPIHSTNCSSQSDSIVTPIDFHEWKTFILKWEGKKRKIELYDELELILTYNDSDYKSDKDSTYYAYFSNPSDDVFIRFHEYEYFYTTKIGSKMEHSTSFSDFNWRNFFFEEMCIDIIVGLCNYCQLNIVAVDALGKTIKTLEVLPDQAIHNLPMWKKVTFHVQNTTDTVYPIKLELETSLTIPAENLTGHWAIKQLTKCYSKDALKTLSFSVPLMWRKEIIPIWCQRLSYNSSHVENINLRAPLHSIPIPIDNNFDNCPSDKIGPYCATTCDRYFREGCDGLIKCTKNHCLCNKYYPGCQKDLKIDPPSIAKITTTSAYAYFKAIDEYVKNGALIGFELKANPDDKKIKRYAGRLGKSNNSDDKYYHTTFTNLRPGTKYSVRMYISYKYRIKSRTIMGETVTFKTLPISIPALVTMVQEGKGKAILSWKPPSSEEKTITTFLIYEEIIASKLEEKPNLNEKKVMEIPFVKSTSEYVVNLYLLPSTHYRISLQAKGENVEGNLSTIEIKSQSALTFKYEPSAILDDKNRQIHVIIPPVVNNTEHSMLYIIVKGQPICKQGGSLSSSLKKIIELEDNEVSWMAATFPTSKTADKLFIVGDELIYNDVIANCPLHPGSSYVIYILVRERGDQNELQEFPALLWISSEFHINSNDQHWKYWAIPLVVLIVILCGIVYRYYKR